MTYYHVEENGNILVLETQQKPNWTVLSPYWLKFLSNAIQETRKNLESEVSQSKERLSEAENKLKLFEENIKNVSYI